MTRTEAVEKIHREFARLGKDISGDNHEALWSLDMIGRLACNAAGVWTYREPGLQDRHHPIQKVKRALAKS